MIGIWNTLLRMITDNYYATNSCILTGKSTMQFYTLRQIHWYSVGIQFDTLSGYRLSWDASFLQSCCLAELLEFTCKHPLIGSLPILTLPPSRTPFLFFRDNAKHFLLRLRQFVAGLSPVPSQSSSCGTCDGQMERGGHLSIWATSSFPCQYHSNDAPFLYFIHLSPTL